MADKWRKTGGFTWGSTVAGMVGLDKLTGEDVEVQNTETDEYRWVHVNPGQDVGEALENGQFVDDD